eukprot:364252-Chlamydomonas_euryale.AAC.6
MSSDTLPPETSFASACCQRAMAGDSRCSRRLSSAPWKYMRMRDTLWKLRLPCDVACCDWRLGPAAAPAPPLRPLLMPLSSDPVRRRRRLAAVASEGARCAASALLWPTVDSADAYAICRRTGGPVTVGSEQGTSMCRPHAPVPGRAVVRHTCTPHKCARAPPINPRLRPPHAASSFPAPP